MYRNADALPRTDRHSSSSRHRQQGSRHGNRVSRKTASRGGGGGGAGGLDVGAGGTHFLADIRGSSREQQNRQQQPLMRSNVSSVFQEDASARGWRARRGRAREGARTGRREATGGGAAPAWRRRTLLGRRLEGSWRVVVSGRVRTLSVTQAGAARFRAPLTPWTPPALRSRSVHTVVAVTLPHLCLTRAPTRRRLGSRRTAR